MRLALLALVLSAGSALAGDCRTLQGVPVYAGSATVIQQQTTYTQAATPVLDVTPTCSYCVPATAALPTSYYVPPVQTFGTAYSSTSYYLPSAATISYRTQLTPITRSFTPTYYAPSAATFRATGFSSHGSAAFVPGQTFVPSRPVFVPQPQVGFAPSVGAGGGFGRLLSLAATAAGGFGGASVGGPVGAIFGSIAGRAVGEVFEGGRGPGFAPGTGFRAAPRIRRR